MYTIKSQGIWVELISSRIYRYNIRGVIRLITRGLVTKVVKSEPNAMKVARSVLRGLGVSNDFWLPDTVTPGAKQQTRANTTRIYPLPERSQVDLRAYLALT